MKKLILCVAIMIATLISCTKEDINCNSTCGVIANDGITDGCYWLEIRNDCSNNKKKFCFDQDVWMDAYVGSHFCVTNQGQW